MADSTITPGGLDASQIHEICEAILAQAKDDQSAANCLDRAREIAANNTALHEPNLTLSLVMEKCSERDQIAEQWLTMNQRFPDCIVSQKYSVRWLYQLGRHVEAQELVESCGNHQLSTPLEALHRAQLHREIRNYEQSNEILLQAIEDFPKDPGVRILLSKGYLTDGKVGKAWKYFEPIMTTKNLSPSGVKLRQDLSKLVGSLERLGADDWLETENTTVAALKAAIALFNDRKLKPTGGNKIGPTALMTSSLAGGGAERQIVNTAIHLTRLSSAKQKVAGVELTGPFALLATSLEPHQEKDFYLPVANAGGVKVVEVRKLDATPMAELCADMPDFELLIPMLPRQALLGVEKLVTYFRQEKTEVAFIWQDGAVLQAALAALVAGVPHIIASFRGLPPHLRPHLFREEYEELYKSLAMVPGFSFASNSRVSADAYCEWLGIPKSKFTVVPNGVALPDPKNASPNQQMWQDFTDRTPDATRTIGGVFRFSVDKQSLLWISFAREYLKRHPHTRFLIVGGGSLMEEAQDQAKVDGIADQILFVGVSDDVPFWLKKMDVSVLLSKFEGLPNVLVEAQMAGIPVVSTPAGSAGTTFIQNETGFLLSQAESPPLDEICDNVEAAFKLLETDEKLSEKAMQHANAVFSIDNMIANTVSLLNQA